MLKRYGGVCYSSHFVELRIGGGIGQRGIEHAKVIERMQLVVGTDGLIGLRVSKVAVQLCGLEAKHHASSRIVATQALVRAGVEIVLRACAAVGLRDDQRFVFGCIHAHRVGFAGVPFVGRPAQRAVGIANQ